MSVDNKSWKKCDIFIFQFKGLEVFRTFFMNFMELFFTYNLQDPSYKFPYGNKVLNKFDFNFLKRHVSSFGIPRSLLAECYILRTLLTLVGQWPWKHWNYLRLIVAKPIFGMQTNLPTIFSIYTRWRVHLAQPVWYCKERSSSTWLG